MAEQYLSLGLLGYWRDIEANLIPEDAGLYFVHACAYDPHDDSLSIHRLLHIGKSRNVRYRITHHDDKLRWERLLEPGEELCYSITPVSHVYRERCLAALIFAHQPPANDEHYRDAFPFDTTRVTLSGKTRLLKPSFIVTGNVIAE